jgi:hypothetical protein
MTPRSRRREAAMRREFMAGTFHDMARFAKPTDIAD